MKYTSLKKDIINILHSDDYELYLKFYDENGNITVNPMDAEWCYISNNNYIIKFMNNNNPNLLLLKDNKSSNEVFKDIIQRLRKLCILNGISVQIRIYKDLNQRKIYNYIKNDIIKSRQEEQMNESINDKLLNCFANVIHTARNTKKSSDFYMSECVKNNTYNIILNEMISEIDSIYKLSKLNLKESLKPLLTCSSKQDIKNLLENLDEKTLNGLYENINNINNISKYVKNEYLNNKDFTSDKPKTFFVMENVKVYPIKEHQNKDNLINAYNKLITFDIKNNFDLLKYIKNEKLCETYNVSRNDLIDFVISNNFKEIKQKRAFVFETMSGDKFIFNNDISCALKAIAEHINNGGEKDDNICKNIIKETIKYNHIKDFIETYKENYFVKEYICKFNSMIKESLYKFNNYDSKHFINEDDIDYKNEYEELCNLLGIEHQALKYIAMENAYSNEMKSKIILESNMNDLNILTKELKPYCKSLLKLQSLIESIMLKRIKIKNTLTESKNSIKEKVEFMYNELCYENGMKSILASSLFNILHTKHKLNENQIKYIDTLIRYLM